jgi:hypothetical protein
MARLSNQQLQDLELQVTTASSTGSSIGRSNELLLALIEEVMELRATPTSTVEVQATSELTAELSKIPEPAVIQASNSVEELMAQLEKDLGGDPDEHDLATREAEDRILHLADMILRSRGMADLGTPLGVEASPNPPNPAAPAASKRPQNPPPRPITREGGKTGSSGKKSGRRP